MLTVRYNRQTPSHWLSAKFPRNSSKTGLADCVHVKMRNWIVGAWMSVTEVGATMKLKRTLLALSLASGIALGTSGQASAGPVYFEDFNSDAFVGKSLGLSGIDLTSDRWASTTYYFINDAKGWDLQGGAYLARHTGTSDGALLLNENDGVATTIYNLTPGQTYTLSMLLWGDNREKDPYVLNVNIGGAITIFGGTDLAAGTNPGTTLNITFTATSSSTTLRLTESTPAGSEASPIVDNITVTAVPDAASSLLLLGMGLAGLGAWRKRS